MKTNEIIAGLRNCVTTQFTGCKECPAYCRSASCLNRLHTAAADVLEAQQKRIEQLEAERRWIPVTERLPTREDANETGSILAINKDEKYVGRWIWDIVARWPDEFTDWMPLPQPPKGE